MCITTLSMYGMWNITHTVSSLFSWWTFQKLVFGNSFCSHLMSVLCCHRVQLVGGLLLEPLVRGSKPSGVRIFLRGWGLGPHMSTQGTLVRKCRESHLKTIRPPQDRTPRIGFHYPNWLVTNSHQSLCQLLAKGVTWWQDSSNYGKGW